MPHFDTAIQARLHKPWSSEREQTIARLYASRGGCDPRAWDSRDELADRTASKLANCGRYASAYQGRETGRIVISGARCKSRLCPRCNAIRAKELEKAITDRVEAMDSPRMITLTLDHRDESCKQMVDRLVNAFRKLRRSKTWKAKINGGVSVIEITRNKREGRWHAHMHILADGEYWAQSSMSAAWCTASGGARIVDVRMVHKRSAASRYVSKYVAKCKGPENLSPDELADFCEGLHGLRQVQTFGTMHGRTTPRAEPRNDTHTDHVVPLGPLVRAQTQGDDRAGRILRCLHLASRLPLAPDTGLMSQRDVRRSCKAAQRAGDWWHDETRNAHEHTPEPAEPPPIKHRPDHRPLRLWEDEHDRSRLCVDG